MTTEQKNVEIAKMLGAREEQWYPPNKNIGSTGLYYIFDREMAKRMGKTTTEAGDYAMKFHSDANWQYEALDWICKQGYTYELFRGKDTTSHLCLFYTYNTFEPPTQPVFENNEWKEKINEAVFEALYQFSQYLKQQKDGTAIN